MADKIPYNFRLECEYCGRHTALYDYSPRWLRLCKTCIMVEEAHKLSLEAYQ
jgi:ribosomal protein S14